MNDPGTNFTINLVGVCNFILVCNRLNIIIYMKFRFSKGFRTDNLSYTTFIMPDRTFTSMLTVINL